MKVLILLFLFADCIRRSEQENNRLKEHNDGPNTTFKLEALRKIMDVDALFVTTHDAHQTEFVSDADKRLQYISHFTGSNGETLITGTKAALWTDSRYHIQAAKELDDNWILMKTGVAGVPTKDQWLNEQFPLGARIGADPELIPAESWTRLETQLKEASENFSLVKTDGNLIDKIWTEKKIIKSGFILEKEFSGMEWCDKVNATRNTLKKLQADSIVVTALDEVAWLLNVRGYDVPHAMLLKSYVIVMPNETLFYVDPRKVEDTIISHFKNNSDCANETIVFKSYQDIWDDLPHLSKVSQKVVVPSSCVFNPGASKRIYDSVAEGNRLFVPSPIIDLKAVKNPTEILKMENSNIKDSIALCRFLSYFKRTFNSSYWDEIKVAEFVDRFRAEEEFFLDISFPTIAGFGPNGALPHYQPNEHTNIRIRNDSTLVIDSGGQYYDGTTDVTRTLHMGTPTPNQKEMYTRVLMGNLQTSFAIFPPGMNTATIDVYARSPLWEVGKDYGHGTGHGVGMVSVVHESPLNIMYRSAKPETLKLGHFITIEPGFYQEDDFGIRLENLVLVVEKPFNHTTGSQFLRFKTVSYVPYEMTMVDVNLLTSQHIKWLNDYNSQIRTVIGAALIQRNDTETYKWLVENTGPL